MRQDLKTLWLEKLRSGNFPQGAGVLKKGVAGAPGTFEYCCLGVLCEAALELGFEGRWSERQSDEWGVSPEQDFIVGDSHHRAYLPEKLLTFAEIPSGLRYPRSVGIRGDKNETDIILTDENKSPTLNTASELNDERGLNFEEIASLVEANL